MHTYKPLYEDDSLAEFFLGVGKACREERWILHRSGPGGEDHTRKSSNVGAERVLERKPNKTRNGIRWTYIQKRENKNNQGAK